MKTEDLLWLTKTIYFEARGESDDGKIAVGQVILNRVKSRRFPNTVKEVCLQPKQFSCYNDGEPPIKDEKSYKKCEEAAEMCFLLQESGKDFGGADHYFADYIKPPRWAKKMEYLTKIGKHLFYRS